MDRDIIAFGVALLMALALVAFALYQWHYSHGRSYRRRQRRENAAYQKLMEETQPRDRP